jgi:hypothetical protein
LHSEILDKEETHHHEIADRMTLLENYAQNIETEKKQITEDHLKMQTHTMKYNLIFITSLFLKFHGNNFPYTFVVFVVRKAGNNIAGFAIIPFP